MVKTHRLTGFNGARLLKLRRQERWSQAELAEKLGVHRATIVRWESGLAEPPEGTVQQLVQLFGVARDWLFRFEEESLLKPAPISRVEDDLLKGIPLRKLQRWTAPALQLLGKSATSLALRVDIKVKRLQEILDGHRPTSLEIQLLREGLGADFNPTPTLMKKIQTRPDSTQRKLAELEKQVAALSAQLAQLQQTVERLVDPLHEAPQAVRAKAKRRTSS